MHTDLNDKDKQRAAVEKIINSSHSKRLIVAGPGAGKTTVFKLLLEQLPPGPSDRRLALTFINALRDDLHASLAGIAVALTFHGYCHRILRADEQLRAPLSDNFDYYPKLIRLVKSDWEHLRGTPSPKFLPFLRNLKTGEETKFFLLRSAYYDAVGFEDSIVRAFLALANYPDRIPQYDLVIVDEYQDFNKSEVGIIQHLAAKNRILIAGDDDQALYRQLRDASEQFIRDLHAGGEFSLFELPFCMRCTTVVVEAVNDVLRAAKAAGLLKGRIEKTFQPFPPAKQKDSSDYPKIKVVRTSVQNSRANYFAKYIEQEISKIPEDDISDSHKKAFPTALVIGSKPYLPEIEVYLRKAGFQLLTKAPLKQGLDEVDRAEGIARLHANQESNLGWRICLEADGPPFVRDVLKQSTSGTSLEALIPLDYKAAILAEVAGWTDTLDEESKEVWDSARPLIKLTSFEGSKGLSAHHVFVVGLQDAELPKKVDAIKDVEIRKFLVALTRTRKQCHLLYSARSRDGRTIKKASVFLNWIAAERKQSVLVNSSYWKRSQC